MAEGLKIKVFGDTKDFEKSLHNLKNVGKKSLEGLKSVGEKSMTALKTTATASLGAIAAGLTASVNAGKDFEQTFAKASTLFGDVNVQTDKLKTNLLDISNNTGVAAAELNEGLYSALSAGVEVTEDMQTSTEFLSGSAKLAKAGFTDVETAISATAKTLNAYNLPASEANKIQDMLIQTQNKGITTVDELGATLAQVTPTAAAFGVSFDQVSASLSTMTAQGTPTAQATTQLNSLIAELGKNGTVAAGNLEKAAKGSKYAGMSFKEMMDNGANLGDILSMMNDYAAKSGVSLVDMFSSIEAGKSALSIMTNDGAKFNENLKSMADSAGMVDSAYEKMSNTLETQLDKLKQNVTNLGIAIYEENNTVFAQMAGFGAECMSKISEGFESSGTEGMITALGNVLSDVLTKTTEKLPEVVNITGDLMSSLVDGIDKNLSKMSNAAEKIISSLKNGITDFMPKLKPIVKEIGNILAQGVIAYQQVFWNIALNVVTSIAQGIAKNSKKISKQAVSLINSIIKTATDNLPLLIQSASDILTNVMKSLANNSGVITSNIKNLIVQICNAISNNAPQLIQAGVELIKALIKGILENAGEIISAILGTIGELLKELGKISPLIVGIGAAITANFVVSTIMGFVEALKAGTAATKALDAAQKLLNATQLASPIGWITAGVGLLATALTTAAIASDDAVDSQDYLTASQKKAIEASEGFRQEIEDNINALDKQVKKVSTEFDYYDSLSGELDTIVDKNGKIKDGYEDRAKVITNELSKALGIEIDINGKVIESYDTLQSKLKETIELKEAQTLLDNTNDNYLEALESKKEATDKLNDSLKKLNDEQERDGILTNEKLNEYNEWFEKLNSSSFSNLSLSEQEEISQHVKEIVSELNDEYGKCWDWGSKIAKMTEESNARIEQQTTEYNKASAAAEENQARITAFTELQEAVASGNLERIKQATAAMEFTAETGKAFTIENLEEQKQLLKEQLDTYKQMVENHEEGAEELLSQTENSLDKINEQIADKFMLDNLGEGAMASLANGIKSGAEKDVNSQLEQVAIMCGTELARAKDGSYQVGETTTKELANGIKSGKITVTDAAQELVNWVCDTATSEENMIIAQNSGGDIAHAIASGARAMIAEEQMRQEFEAKRTQDAIEKTKKYLQEQADLAAKLKDQKKKEAEEERQRQEEAQRAAEEAARKAAEEAKKRREEAKRLAQERKQLRKDAVKTATEAYKEINDKLKDINKDHKKKLSELKKDYKNNLANIKQEYKNTLQSIADSQASYADKIMSFSDLFGATQQATVTNKKGVLANLEYTTTQYKEFYNTIEALRKRGLSEDLINQFTDLGVGYAAQLKQIASMNDTELKAYQDMLNKQQEIADKLAAQKYEGEKQAAKTAYDEAIAKANADYDAQVKAQNKKYKKQIKKLSDDTEAYMEKLGKQLRKGLKKGSKMSSKEAEEIAENLVGEVVKKVKQKLKINSPSKVFEFDIAGNMVKGLARGLTNGTKDVVKSAELQVDQLNKAYDNIAVANKLKSAFANAKSAVGATLGNISANITANTPNTIVNNYTNCNNNTTTESIQNVFEEPMQAPDEIARAIKYNETYGLGGA